MEELAQCCVLESSGLIRNWTPQYRVQKNGRGELQWLRRGWWPIILTEAFQVKDLKSPEGSVGS